MFVGLAAAAPVVQIPLYFSRHRLDCACGRAADRRTADAAPEARSSCAPSKDTAGFGARARARASALRSACAVHFAGITELLRSRQLRLLLGGGFLVAFGGIGLGSIMASFVQSAFDWRQGRLEARATAPAHRPAACTWPRVQLSLPSSLHRGFR